MYTHSEVSVAEGNDVGSTCGVKGEDLETLANQNWTFVWRYPNGTIIGEDDPM